VKKKGWILVLAAPVKGKIAEKLEGNLGVMVWICNGGFWFGASGLYGLVKGEMLTVHGDLFMGGCFWSSWVFYTFFLLLLLFIMTN
jgi:hypothetical protein